MASPDGGLEAEPWCSQLVLLRRLLSWDWCPVILTEALRAIAAGKMVALSADATGVAAFAAHLLSDWEGRRSGTVSSLATEP
jgi:hypothetical protein